MSKRKKRRARVTTEDASSRPTSSGATSNAPKPVADTPGRIGLVVLIVTGSLWVGWLGFLTYVALSRR